jgi:hypothetical protein
MTPRLSIGDARHQDVVHDQPFHEWTLADGRLWTRFYRLSFGYLVRFPDLADFEVSSDGYDVHLWPVPGVGSGTVQHLYSNQVQPLALSRQGQLVLHASAVELNGEAALAFMGQAGQGKSTLAASFATSGSRFLTDDGLHLGWSGEELLILPSHPSIRLWEDSQQALLPVDAVESPPVEFTAKARFLAGPGLDFCDTARPLKRLFFLGDGTATRATIAPMRPAEALVRLVRNSFLLDLSEQHALASHFEEISRIANLPVHYHLDYPRRYDELSRVRDAIAHHCLQESE